MICQTKPECICIGTNDEKVKLSGVKIEKCMLLVLWAILSGTRIGLEKIEGFNSGWLDWKVLFVITCGKKVG